MQSMITVSLAWAQLFVTVTAAPPFQPTTVDIASTVAAQDQDIKSGDIASHCSPGDATGTRTLYSAMSLFCMSVVAGMVGRTASIVAVISRLMFQALVYVAWTGKRSKASLVVTTSSSSSTSWLRRFSSPLRSWYVLCSLHIVRALVVTNTKLDKRPRLLNAQSLCIAHLSLSRFLYCKQAGHVRWGRHVRIQLILLL
jgi:hypothetical protein